MLLVTLSIITIIILKDNKQEIKLEKVKLNEVNNQKGIALMLEQSNGKYEESTNSDWPNSGYIFNNRMSGCVDNNGNTIDNALKFTDNILTLKTKTNASCYLYFDIDKTFAIYSESDNSLRFYNNDDYKIIESETTYNNLAVTSIYKNFITQNYTAVINDNSTSFVVDTPWFNNVNNITSIYIEDYIMALNTANWFNSFNNVKYVDVNKLDVSEVKNMERMFSGVGSNVETFEIIGLDNWNTSNVTNLRETFNSMGYNSKKFEIDVSKWDVSNVTSMRNTFGVSGYNSTTWSVGDLSNWDTSNVETMLYMFHYAGCGADTINIGNISNWNVSKVTDMGGMFYNFGVNALNWYIGDLSQWDTSNVISMSGMFDYAGLKTNTFNIGDLSNWNVSNVTNMDHMFDESGRYSNFWYIGNISKWNTSKVTTMHRMFYYAGEAATNWSLDLSNWNVSLVTTYTEFKDGTSSKIKSPIWVN